MNTTEGSPYTPTYMTEYREAFAPVPFTSEDAHGVITDMHTGQVVETPATHPDYQARYGVQATAQSVVVTHAPNGERQ